jgi:3-hydroxybutyryl-CoA dehydrogenase
MAAADVQRVVVIGGGQMGNGIAQVFASAGREVTISDVAQGRLDAARKSIEKSVGRLHAKGVLTDEQAGWCADRIAYEVGVGGVSAFAPQFAIEAITEHVDTKLGVLRELDAALPEQAILASNTSSIPITVLGAATKRAPLVVGMHFMNPPPMLELVEVISGLDTSRWVVDTICDLARDIGKVPVESSDSPGFITNRILMPMINEAFFCLGEGVGTAEGIDDAMRMGMKHPLGPLALADLIGLDTCLAIMEVLHRDLGDDKYRPSPTLRRYVDAGRLGRKSGRGVYEYGDR